MDRTAAQAHEFTKENAAEMQRRMIEKRLATTTPERRSYLARKAAFRRWYKPNGDDIERIESVLRIMADAVAEAMAKEDFDRIVARAAAMAPYERMKIALRTGQMKDVTPEQNQEIERKLTLARERREKAMTVEVESSANDNSR